MLKIIVIVIIFVLVMAVVIAVLIAKAVNDELRITKAERDTYSHMYNDYKAKVETREEKIEKASKIKEALHSGSDGDNFDASIDALSKLRKRPTSKDKEPTTNTATPS